MNFSMLNPINWFSGHKLSPSQTSIRTGSGQGPYTSMFDNWVAREVNPHMYEALREAVAPLDGAINRLCTMDGIIQVETESDALAREIEDWMEGVKVQDMQMGFQSFYNLLNNEKYEQGCAVGEWVLNKQKNDVGQLRVADSKGLYYRRLKNKKLQTWYREPKKVVGRRDGTDTIERVLRNNYNVNGTITNYLQQQEYRLIKPESLVYLSFNPEGDSPYGTSLMRSTEFDAKVLLTIKNALFNTWERFGDPIFNVVLKKKPGRQGSPNNVAETQLNSEQERLSDSIRTAVNAKRSGNSADVINVVGPNDELSIEILGAGGDVLEVEMPARHVLEQIVSKSGLPSWMLGFHWSTAERLAESQGIIVTQESKTRFAAARPALRSPIEAMLRARGVTFNKRDFELAQELPNLKDVLKEAQSGFLIAQTELMRREGTTNPGGDNEPKYAKVMNDGKVLLPTDENYNSSDNVASLVRIGDQNNVYEQSIFEDALRQALNQVKKKHSHDHKTESYVEDEAELTRLENQSERSLKNGWNELYRDTLDALGVSDNKMPEPVFVFDIASMLPILRDLEADFITQYGADDAVLARNIYQAWLRGIANASTELDVANVVTDTTLSRVSRQLSENALTLVTDATVRSFRNDIVLALEEGAYNGLNPREIASQLRKRFNAHNVDWERIARSEIAAAQAQGKVDHYSANGISRYNIIRAGGACPICIGLAENGPYVVGSGPLPVRDSHPNCRCTIEADT